MAAETQPPAPPARRPVRALAAWMDEGARQRLDRGANPAPLPDGGATLRGRGPLDQSGLLAAAPVALADHLAAVSAGDQAQRMVSEGWEIAWVNDLRRVIAAQPVVLTDRAAGEPADPSPGDLPAIARLTLPSAAPSASVDHRFDEEAQTWMVSSPNPNLRISGTFGGEIQPGVMGFGFLFSVLPSYLSVAEQSGRLVLRDGYHRAYRLLGAGIVAAPAFVRRFARDEPMFRRGMLPAEVYLGERPPTLADYHDDTVSVAAWIPVDDTRARVAATPTRLVIGTIA